MDKEAANLFFQLISRRYEQKSTIITMNKTLSKWGGIFGDPVIANAILDRLLHHSHIVSIIGPSYRVKDVLDSLDNWSKLVKIKRSKMVKFILTLSRGLIPTYIPLFSTIYPLKLSLFSSNTAFWIPNKSHKLENSSELRYNN